MYQVLVFIGAGTGKSQELAMTFGVFFNLSTQMP
jgi:hypothetical protein